MGDGVSRTTKQSLGCFRRHAETEERDCFAASEDASERLTTAISFCRLCVSMQRITQSIECDSVGSHFRSRLLSHTG